MLTDDELMFYSLRDLYMSCGCKLFRMSDFEEYDFYADKKDFLPSKHILTFTDADGRLMALRPDVTLSLIKNAGCGKYYYHENVYRVLRHEKTFREIPQAGIEFIGHTSQNDILKVIELALHSLRICANGKNYVLDAADTETVRELIPFSHKTNDILACISSKNIHGLKELHAPEKLTDLLTNGGYLPFTISDEHIRPDYSCIDNLSYYSGVVFKGYIEGKPRAVLSGGQYQIMGVKGLGFAVYLSEIYGG